MVWPTPPTSFDYSSAALSALARTYGDDGPSGCSAGAALFRLRGVTSACGGSPATFTDAQVQGFVTALPTTDSRTAARALLRDGYPDALSPLAFGYLENADLAAVTWLFGATVIGDPSGAQAIPASGFCWDVPGSADPHGFRLATVVGIDDTGFIACAGGQMGHITREAVLGYTLPAMRPLFLLCPDLINQATGLGPSGHTLAQLQIYLADLEAP
jgi:hypothetical protein